MKKVLRNGDLFLYNDDNQFHCKDGPAIIYKNGSTEWYINGKLHRLDGPAIEFANGKKYWYINNVGVPYFSSSKYCIRIAKKHVKNSKKDFLGNSI